MQIRLAARTPPSEPVVHELDARRLRAYAAAAGVTDPRCLDPSDGGPVAHPLHPVCLEWPVLLQGTPGLVFPSGGSERGLHVDHELQLRRRLRAGDRLATTARLVGAEPRRAGVRALIELVTAAATGEPVAVTRQGVLFPGARLEGNPGAVPPPSSHDRVDAEPIARLALGLADAIVYTECSGIHNPIHTEHRAARSAGLPGPILHGTATLARCVTAVVEGLAEGDLGGVRRLGGRFTGMVPLPAQVDVRAERRASTIRFEARLASGEPVLSGGFVELGS